MKLQTIQIPINDNLKTTIYQDGCYYIISEKRHSILKSTDMNSWEEYVIDTDNYNDTLLDIVYGNDKFITCGKNYNKTYFYISDDGINYTKKFVLEFPLKWEKIVYVNNVFIAITSVVWGSVAGSIIMVSDDGNNWTYNEFTTGNFSGSDIIYEKNKYWIVGSNGGIAYSNDLKTWTRIDSKVSSRLKSIIYAKNKFVVVGYDGIILTSSDGISWTRQNCNTSSAFSKIRYGNGLFCACGYNGILYTSIDGVSWNLVDTNTKSMLYGLVYINNRYLFTGNNSYAAILDVSRDITSSDDDCLFIYNPKLELLGIVDTFISLRWQRKYFESGDFTLVVSATKNNVNLLTKIDNLIIRNNYTETAIIENYEIDEFDNEIELTISGRFLSSVFERRIIQKKVNFSGEAINGMKFLISNCTPITNNFEIEPTQISSPKIDFQCTYKNLYSYLVKLSKFSLIGFRLVPNIENKIFIFENYKGKDRTSTQIENERYAFSDDQNNIEKSSLIVTGKTEYNYALVGGAGEDSNRILQTVSKGSLTGFDLRETFVDAKNQSNNDISQSDYLEQLNALGVEALKDRTVTFSSTVSTIDYKVKWDLGDIVDLKRSDWNIIEQKIISEIEEIISDGERKVTITLGTPISEILEEEK